MKIAVPTRAYVVDDHFGHCEAYTIFTIGENKNIEKIESLPSPQGCGCKSNIASDLQQIGVKIMLAGNMGHGALNVLTNHGIKVYRGCSGDVTALVKKFLAEGINDSGESCHHHDLEGADHQCSHN
ncbi:NifB/NifX family molybdenum-iron cluster-binding protein [uncultured Bacteroides sp.]|uniref:NifB/NifX family molybdenum-iron cluster-binding protein n=1 Tax=uncultured Bacteroides sp. TaxID=162156 RepID=UPI002AA6F2BA|nr:NifB/NifX family molybdenum-iron cluster-binding protein [uncultured Bacteroides sp.]